MAEWKVIDVIAPELPTGAIIDVGNLQEFSLMPRGVIVNITDDVSAVITKEFIEFYAAKFAERDGDGA